MLDATTKFFEDLDRREFEPLLAKASGTLRVDLHEGPQTSHWLLRVDHGRVQVTREERDADTVVGMDPELFEALAEGREAGLAALLRGDLAVTGDLRRLVLLDRLFPGPPDSRGPRRFEGRREVR
ncbi:SCP2 sterol-binding domain-containing protein [Micromonospora sp. KLBMP9576]|uniref:SCP2 sterol-binding domain-containing protein n=1 Tax=Micromonospora sp. KLBMP9576 TaxID=3424769 RepID=UPI003D8E5882